MRPERLIWALENRHFTAVTICFRQAFRQCDIPDTFAVSRDSQKQTNGMVERFNGRISSVVKQTRFASSTELEMTLTRYLNIYNHPIPKRALNHQTPIQSLKKWYSENPDLFAKQVYKQAGLDT